MNLAVQTKVPPLPEAAVPKQSVRTYSELLKLRVTSMVVATAFAGYYLGCIRSNEGSSLSWAAFHAMLGIGLASGGAAALNQVLEKREDSLMLRTRRRPIPAGDMSLLQGTIIGVALVVGGCLYLAFFANAIAAVLTLLTAASYVLVYTPMKTRSPWATFVGAVPGAMPPLLGWVAARGVVEWQAVVLFAILFVWQFPHFESIAWLYREDYARAGILMLPVAAPDGRAVAREAVVYAALLLPVSLVPTLMHMAGDIYFIIAIVFGLAYLYYALSFSRIANAPDAPITKKYARQLLRMSVIYLPILFGVLMWNAIPPARILKLQ
ncbi:MAG: heme o synthase [Acidobacteriaceae bacterium]